MSAPRRVVFVSYDGALDPLGQTQVLPYLLGLAARGVALALISFEKPERWADGDARAAMAVRLGPAGIDWRPLRYHRRPRLPATALDLFAGARALRAFAGSAAIVHGRGEVAMAMARLARLPPRVRVLHDMRALFSEERVVAGSWTRDGVLDRIVRRVEAGNLRRGDGVVVLSERGRAMVAGRTRPGCAVAVIPTCVDLGVFGPRPAGMPPEYGVAYSGALGASYMTDETVDFARRHAEKTGERALFLTPQPQVARAAGADETWAEVRSEAPAGVPALLRRARALVFFRRPSPANLASCPTKVAEALASGLPIVCNRGIGDLDALLPAERVGVLLEGFTPEARAAAAAELAALLADPALAARCRRVAEERFGLAQGVAAYHRLYRDLGCDAR